MAFLYVPPTQYIIENKELIPRFEIEAQKYRAELLNSLNVVGKEVVTIKSTGFINTKIYSWSKEYNGILATQFIFPMEKNPKNYFLKMSTLVRQEDCVHLGSVWTKNNFFIPSNIQIENSTVTMADISNRNFDRKSSVRVDSEFNTDFSERGQLIFNGILSETFANKKIPTITTMSRIYCKFNLATIKEIPIPFQSENYPAKPHQIVTLRFLSNDSKSKINSIKISWPKFKIQSEINSGTFGEKNKNLLITETPEIFQPNLISEKIMQQVIPGLADLNEEKFTVLKRYGQWVWLNRGQAYGLTIGTRLKGPGNSQLHIIQYAPEVLKEIDASIAFIRKEKDDQKVKVGDSVTLDKKIYFNKKK